MIRRSSDFLCHDIETCAFDSPEALSLMMEMWREIDRIYGNPEATAPEMTGMDAVGAAFLIARADGRAVGCVALRPISAGIAEVKRMYVQPVARRGGLALRLMRRLEEIAREYGFREIWLETGLKQPAAIRLYEGLGYERIDGFGDYTHDPVSVCYGKKLT